MVSAWDELLEKLYIERTKSVVNTTVVFSAFNLESLQNCQKYCFPDDCKVDNLMSMVSYKRTENYKFLKNSEELGLVKNSILDIYTNLIEFENYDSLAYLKCLLPKNEGSMNIKWCVILDWAIADQRRWLGYLRGYTERLESLGFNMVNNKVCIICLHSEKIYDLQRLTTSWSSSHIDFIQQTLRSFCLYKRCSLLYIDNGELSNEELKDVFNEVVIVGKFHKLEMVASSRICISEGSDSIGLIQTLNETFDPTEVMTDEFQYAKYENKIPMAITEDVGPSTIISFESQHHRINEQTKLAEMYKSVRLKEDRLSM